MSVLRQHHTPTALDLRHRRVSIREKLWQVSWSLVLLICAVGGIGILMLYSAANGDMEPWAGRQMTRFAMGIGLMIAVAVIDIRLWMRWAYVIYMVALALLIAVEIKGTIGMGAQRWIDLHYFFIQPSEVMKIGLVLALARFFHGAALEEVTQPSFLIPPVLMVLAPAALVIKQPDLGTALILLMVGTVIFFMAGVKLWKFIVVGVLGIAAIPIGWQFLHDYQKNRVLTFIDPERDPLGAGYHILQSKIAMGSGGVFGRGYMQGSQSHLNFLPEKQTDFIFTMLTEELGMVGGVAVLGLYALIIAYGFFIANRSRNHFGRLVALGVNTTFFLYVFVNAAMVMGLLPVVGIPLPLISYGGTALLTLMMGFGLLMSVHVHRDQQIGRRGSYDD